MPHSASVVVLGSESALGQATLARFEREQVVVRGVAALGMLDDPNAAAAAFRGCATVVYCRADCSGRSTKAALLTHYVARTENVLAAARHAGCKRLVVTSSADATLSASDRVYLSETDYVRPASRPLPGALAVADDIVAAASTPSFETIVLRPAWLWGEHTPQVNDLGAEARSAGVRLVGFGRTYFATCHIDNAAAACVRAALAPAIAGANRTFYVSDDEPLSAREFFSQLTAALGLPAPRFGLPFAIAYPLARLRGTASRLSPDDILRRGRRSLFNIQAARDQLGYAPEISVAEGMRRIRSARK